MTNEAKTVPRSSSAIACSLTPEAMRAARTALLPGLLERATEFALTDRGCRVSFAPDSDTLLAIVRTIDAERQCCRWMRFDMTVPADGGAFELTVSGPAGAREFLEALVTP